MSSNQYRRVPRYDSHRRGRFSSMPSPSRQRPKKFERRRSYDESDLRTYVEHRPTEQYKMFIQREGRRQPSPLPHRFPEAPYGTHKGQPIQGPANWNQLWDRDTMGQDASAPPMSQRDLDFIQTSDEKLKKIHFGRLIAAGAYGVVYAVTAIKDGQQTELACKVIKPKVHHMSPVKASLLLSRKHVRSFQEVIDQLLNDMTVQRYLNHPNLVEMVDYINIPDSRTGFPFSTVMLFYELCDGDLFDLLEKNPPDFLMAEHHCRHWFKQIANAVKYLHDNRIVHLDIKPENIFYVYQGLIRTKRQRQSQTSLDLTFKLGDLGFGICYTEDQPFELHELRGTKSYVAAELLNTETSYNTKSIDIYSFGSDIGQVSDWRSTIHPI